MLHDNNGSPAEGSLPISNQSSAEYKGHSPAAVAIAGVPRFQNIAELWQVFREPDSLWLAMLASGCQFHRPNRFGRWRCIPPSHALSGAEAKAIAWGQQALSADPVGRSIMEAPQFEVTGRLLSETWSVDYTAERLDMKRRDVWGLIRDGSLGAFELSYGRWQVSPASVERYLQRSKPRDAKQGAA